MTFPFATAAEGVSYASIPSPGNTSNIFLVGPTDNYLIIDTGVDTAAAELIETLESNGYGPNGVAALVVTHGHIDHYGGVRALHRWCGADVWAHPAAAANIEDPHADMMTSPHRNPADMAEIDRISKSFGSGTVRVERLLREGDRVIHAGFEFQVLHMPGHNRGQATLWEPNRRMAFVGDVIQGGSDGADNWLGLYEDCESQARSLERLKELGPAWLFRGHREPRSGDAVGPDIASAQKRLDDIESALLAGLSEHGHLSDVQATLQAFKRVLGKELEAPPLYGITGVRSMLAWLGRRGMVRTTDDRRWEPAN